jgi:dTDP-4-dehydrorhamnose reductase
MILLLGATSYIGQAFARALRRRKDSFIPLARNAFDYTRFEFLFDYIRKVRPDLVINAAEYPVRTNEDLAESERVEMLQSNTFLPQTIARVCGATATPWAHISSGSIYIGAKVGENGGFRIEEDLSRPALRRLFTTHPERIRGFTEMDEPNFSFKRAPCTFYSGTKALAEEAIRDQMQIYLWRLRMPFNEQDEPRNFLSQLRDGWRFRDAINSLSQLDECVAACLALWDRRAAFGIYNIVNPGAVTTHEVAQMIQRILKPPRRFELMVYDPASSTRDGKEPRSDCILDVSKLLATGIRLRNVREALTQSLQRWVSQSSAVSSTST